MSIWSTGLLLFGLLLLLLGLLFGLQCTLVHFMSDFILGLGYVFQLSINSLAVLLWLRLAVHCFGTASSKTLDTASSETLDTASSETLDTASSETLDTASSETLGND